MFQHFDDIVADVLKVGTMLIVSHLITGGDVMDRNWQMGSLFTLLGFTAYHLTTRNLLPTGTFGEYKPIADDTVKVGTMLVVSRLLAGGDVMDRSWQMGSLFTLLGFAAYQLVTKNFVKGSSFGSGGMAATIDDAAKFGTMFVVSQLLSGGSLQDPNWMKASFATIAGFAVYNLVLSNFLK